MEKYFYYAHSEYSLKNGTVWSIIPIRKNQCYKTNDKYTVHYAGNDIKDIDGYAKHFLDAVSVFRTRTEAENFIAECCKSV